MATFEKKTASLLKSRILHTRSMADFFRTKSDQQELSQDERQDAENRWHYWLRKMDDFVAFATELFEIKIDESQADWSQVLQELKKITGE